MRAEFIICVIFSLVLKAEAQTKKTKDSEVRLDIEPEATKNYGPSWAADNAIKVLSTLKNESGPVRSDDHWLEDDIASVYQANDPDRLRALFQISTQTFLTPFIFQRISREYISGIVIVKLNGRYGTMNSKGEVLIPCKYESMETNDRQSLIVAKNGRMGVIDRTNKTLLPFEFSSIKRNELTHSYVLQKGGKYGVSDVATNSVILPIEFDEIVESAEIENNRKVYHVKKNGRRCISNEHGKFILSKWYSNLSWESGRREIVAELDGKFGVIDFSEKVIVPFSYDQLKRISRGEIRNLRAQKNGKWGILSGEGKVLVPFNFISMTEFDDYSVRFIGKSQEGRYGIIDVSGQFLLPVEYENIAEFRHLIVTTKGGRAQVLAKKGLTAVTELLGSVTSVYFRPKGGGFATEGLLLTDQKGKKGLVDDQGTRIISNQYDHIVGRLERYNPNLVLELPVVASRSGKYGLVDVNDKVLVEFLYDELKQVNPALAIAGEQGKVGVIEIANPGNWVLAQEYTFIAYEEGRELVAYKDKFYRYRVDENKLTPVD